ncbi:uncharacterized protein LOC132030899 [Lycium ferocissimum]|uniref:uncharacterized protein LOC132030899 n=1 Tax=Lycium ferocissimum TaxID=112874 RepID=UPI002814CFEA|nr:uncharacterized protein LOC132030899 [Lycium ferocissimum]
MVCKLNEILKCLCCMLCSQLFEEATTVNLCLHTFCKRCVYQAVQETKNCPQCKKDLGSSPEEHLKDDERIRSITQKIQFLLTGKGHLESEANDVKQGAGTSKPPEKQVLDEHPEEPSSFLFTFVPLLGDKRRRLRAIDVSFIHLQDSTMPVSAIQMYIAQKLNMEDPTEVDVVCCGEKLNGDMTVKDIQLIWMSHLPDSEGRKKNWDQKELMIELGYIRSKKPTTSQKK